MDGAGRLRYCQAVVSPPTGAFLPVPSDADTLAAIRASWPPHQAEPRAGYEPLSLEGLVPLDAGVIGDRAGSDHAVVVAANALGDHAGFPLTRRDHGWQIATAGDGTTWAMLEGMRAVEGSARARQRTGFVLQRIRELPVTASMERDLGSDQTNQSVVVDDSVIVKWHTAVGASGRRSGMLRRHLTLNGFTGGAPLLGVLTWHGPDNEEIVVADIDGYLPGAVDGWDLAIAALIERVDPGSPAVAAADELAATLGALTASMHAAASRPSALLVGPRATAGRPELGAWRSEARVALDEAIAIDAPDKDVLEQRAGALVASMETLLSIDRTTVIPIHGDLHLGQVVGWDGGLAVIDFDGPPTPRRAGVPGLQPAVRDVAQMLCSLDQLAVVVDRRTEGRATHVLRRWASAANREFLGAYRDGLTAADAADLLDDRLLDPFIAEQYCRELIYAARVLPRWRYAPLGAMTWRYSSPSA